MDVLVYGGGAVGLGLAASLLKAGKTVTILARADTAEQLRNDGLQQKGIFGTYHAPSTRFRIWETIAQDTGGNPFDYVLVCTKSNASGPVARDLNDHPHVLGPHTKIVLCQNGWGNAGTFAAFFSEAMLFNARVITGFQRPRPNTVDITVHVAPVRIGSIYHDRTADIDPLCVAIQAGGLPCESTGEIVKDLWAKMLYNCALNPLGAIFRVPYGALGASPHTRAIMEDVVREVFQVMAAAGHETYWSRPEDYLSLFFDELIPTTAKHEASTLQDIRAGKPTEIDALNGAVVTLGDRYGVDVRTNRQICRMIKFAENGGAPDLKQDQG